jgi:hypothetical protein
MSMDVTDRRYSGRFHHGRLRVRIASRVSSVSCGAIVRRCWRSGCRSASVTNQTSTFHFPRSPGSRCPSRPRFGVRLWFGVPDAGVVAHGELAHAGVEHERCGGFVQVLDVEPITTTVMSTSRQAMRPSAALPTRCGHGPHRIGLALELTRLQHAAMLPAVAEVNDCDPAGTSASC